MKRVGYKPKARPKQPKKVGNKIPIPAPGHKCKGENPYAHGVCFGSSG